MISVCGPWSATFPKMMLIFPQNKVRKKTNVADELLISLLSYDEVSAFFALNEAAEFKFVYR